MSKLKKSSDPLDKCIFCTRAERLLTFNGLEPGDHVRIGGRHLMFNIFNRQVSLYTHHAIVTGIEPLSATSANLKMVSFQASSFDTEIKAHESTQCINLQYEELYLMRYSLGSSPKPEIIERANAFLRDTGNYNAIWNNCEHFAHYCCTGIKKSNQVYDIQFTLKEMAKSGIQKLVEFFLKAANIHPDDVAYAAFGKNFVGQSEAIALVTPVYLLYCIYQHAELYYDFKNGGICQRCCNDKQNEMWLKFIAYCGTQVGGALLISFVKSTGVCSGAVVGIKVLIALVSMFFSLVVPNVKRKLSSPFQGKSTKVSNLKEIWLGDVISFKLFGSMQDGIVSRIDISPGSSNKRGAISVLHYSLPTVFGRRMIREEEIQVDLDIEIVERHDYSSYKVHAPEIVLKRAWQRIGETKYGFLSNRSCHLCHWAKVDADESIPAPVSTVNMEYYQSLDPQQSISQYSFVSIDHHERRNPSTCASTETWARVREDVKKSQIVRLKVRGSQHYGIVTETNYTDPRPAVLILSVIYRGDNKVCIEESIEINLNMEDIWICNPPLFKRFDPEEIVKRARQKIGVRHAGRFESSIKLTDEIIGKDRLGQISTFSEICPGDAIEFYYQGLQDIAIVSYVNTDSKANDTADVTIIHYASSRLLSAQSVKEESIFMDLKNDKVYLKDYEGFLTYPNEESIERAKSRKGEETFSIFRNPSWDFVRSVKIVQKPAIVNVTHPDQSIKQRVLVPAAGEQYGSFRRLPVHYWRDLKPGRIVEFRQLIFFCQAILTEACEDKGTISVIHYKPHRLLVECVTEERINIDIKRDTIWMYICDPKKANKADVVIRNARKCLQEWRFRSRWGSWDLCKTCVLKANTK